MIPRASAIFLFGSLAFLSTTPETLAHSFPDPSSPEFQVEKAAADFAAARVAAAAAGVSPDLIAAAQSVYSSFLLWPQSPTGVTLSACFWNGASDVRKSIADSDKIWEGFSAIYINFTDSTGELRICSSVNDADIRISLDGNDPRLASDYNSARPKTGFWSTEGREADFTPQGSPLGAKYLVTVNLPNIDRYSSVGDWVDFNDLVRHEMGHARGLLHEHQRNACAEWFDINKIAASQGWSVTYAQQAVASFDQLAQSNDYYRPKFIGGYDILSIMQYNFDKSWYKEIPGKINPCERTTVVSEPSPGDRATLAGMYPLQNPTVAGNVIAAASTPIGGASLVQARSEVFGATVANERARIAILTDSAAQTRALSQVPRGAEAARVQRRLPPTPSATAAASAVLDELQRSVNHLSEIQSGK